MECLKDCCKNFMKKKGKEPETQVIKLKMPPSKAITSKQEPDGGRSGVTEDYLLSKLPPDGREVPFVLPTFKASYIQPRGSRFPSLQAGPQSSARCTYAERKAELVGTSQFTYSPESSFHQGQMFEFISPGSSRRNTLKNKNSSPRSPGWTLKPGGEERLSSSMFDLSSSPNHMQVCHSELHLTTCFQPVNGRIQLQVLAAQNLPSSSSPLTQAYFVKVEMYQLDRVGDEEEDSCAEGLGGLDTSKVLEKIIGRNVCFWQVHLGFDSPVPEAVELWKDTMANPEKVVTAWHRLSAA
ncbi:Tandem C2 domains nuclear protein [Collichthys lucidus]|uniref:Tandem C2 domains nuclear protein n=1 Tax=Collichthys lucidus TaxID=240159 RepID=A0A4U5VFY2_COLLU|nr:Tandem C2 domains nuclear protein [Collichthys lucidus]